MQTLFRPVLLTLVASISCGWAIAARADEKATPAHPPQAPKGYVLVDEETWHKLADEPDRHLERARAAFLKSEFRTATTEIRKAGVHLRIAASHAGAVTKLELTQAEHALEHLAHRVETGAVKSVDELDIITARALHSLADDQYRKAADAWRHHEQHVAGQYLRSAAHNLERATERTGGMLREATAEVSHNSRVLATRLIEGAEFARDEVGAGFEAFGRQIERVGKTVAPQVTGSR
jgi:hypothetical protein